MSAERGPLIQTEPLVHGIGAAGQVPVLVDTGMTMGGTPIYRLTFQGAVLNGHWEPLTNGDTENPEILFSDGDVLMTWVTD